MKPFSINVLDIYDAGWLGMAAKIRLDSGKEKGQVFEWNTNENLKIFNSDGKYSMYMRRPQFSIAVPQTDSDYKWFKDRYG